MYINLQKVKKQLKRGDLELLCAIKQLDTDYLIEEYWFEAFERFKSLDFITEVKTKKKGEHPYKALRLTEKAKKLLISISYEGAVDDESENIGNWLIKVYLKKAGGIVKNKTELKRRIMWFKTVTGIKGNFLAVLIQCSLNDMYDSESEQSFYDFKKDNPRAILSNMAENLFWTAPNNYARNYTIADSPLYRYFEDNEEYVKEAWVKYLNEDGSRKE